MPGVEPVLGVCKANTLSTVQLLWHSPLFFLLSLFSFSFSDRRSQQLPLAQYFGWDQCHFRQYSGNYEVLGIEPRAFACEAPNPLAPKKLFLNKVGLIK